MNNYTTRNKYGYCNYRTEEGGEKTCRRVAAAAVVRSMLIKVMMVTGMYIGFICLSSGFSSRINDGVALAQQKGPEKNNNTGINSSKEAEKKENSSPFVLLKKEGVKRCATLVETLGNMLTLGSTYSVLAMVNKNNPDVYSTHSIIGMDYKTRDYTGPAAGFIFANPGFKSTCEGSMVRVVPFSKSCGAVPEYLPKDSKEMNNLHNIRAVALSNGGVTLLIPVDRKCVVVTIATATNS